MRFTSGVKLGWYEIIEPLGEGGMGEVYRAHDGRLHRDVALKIVHPDLAGSDPLARFRREARVLASLCHPNVASVYEFEELEEAAFIVMELVPGQTLASRLAQGPMPIAEAWARPPLSGARRATSLPAGSTRTSEPCLSLNALPTAMAMLKPDEPVS